MQFKYVNLLWLKSNCKFTKKYQYLHDDKLLTSKKNVNQIDSQLIVKENVRASAINAKRVRKIWIFLSICERLEMKKSKKLKVLTNASSNSNELNVFFKSSSNATTTIYKRLRELIILNTIMTTTTKNFTRLFDVFSKHLSLLQILKLKKSLTTFRKIFSITSLTNTTMKTQRIFLSTSKMCITSWIEYARKS